MQIFKLVKGGVVDNVIGFDSLPESILAGVPRGGILGWARHWKDFMGVDPKDKDARPFYVLDYIATNKDKEKWSEICAYVKRNVDPSVRMLDKVEAMAKPLAENAYSDVTLEPEDVPIIKITPPAEPDAEAPRRRRSKEEAVA